MQKSTKDMRSILHSNRFKTILFVLILATVIKLIMNLLGQDAWYSLLLEKQFTRTQSTMIYYGILVVAGVLYFLTLSDNNKWSHIIVISLLPVSVYVAFFYSKSTYVYGMMIVLFILLSVADIWFLVSCYREAKQFHIECTKKELRREVFWDVTKTAAGIIIYAGALSLFMACVTIWDRDVEVTEPIAYATNVRDLRATTGEDLWEPNKESLRLLAEDVYCTLSTQERLNALQEFLNIECEYLGIEPCQLVMEDLSKRGIGGYYREEDRIISLEYTYVERDNSLYGMHVLLHEVYHCYQYECVKNYQEMQKEGVLPDTGLKYYRDCARWAEEFRNYHSCSDTGDFADYYQYASQSVETSADEYRNQWLGAYWEYINDIGKSEKTPEELLEEVG